MTPIYGLEQLLSGTNVCDHDGYPGLVTGASMEFSEIENLVQSLIGQAEVAISLKQLCKRLNSDKRGGPAYDDTYAGHGFVLA